MQIVESLLTIHSIFFVFFFQLFSWVKACSGVNFCVSAKLKILYTGQSTLSKFYFSLTVPGHTSGITLLSLFVCHYTPESFWPLRKCVFVLNVLGTFFIICAREHYSVDILIALVVCVLCFNYYHALVDARHTSSWFYPTYPFAEEFREHKNVLYQWPFAKPAYLSELTRKLNLTIRDQKFN